MRSTLALALCFAALALGFIQPAAAATTTANKEVTFFPPVGCTTETPIMSWDGKNNVKCIASNDDLVEKIIICNARLKFYAPMAAGADGNGCAEKPEPPPPPVIPAPREYSKDCVGRANTEGNPVYCDGDDIRVSCTKTGVGNNNWITLLDPNGCGAYEGPNNRGNQGCHIVCRTR